MMRRAEAALLSEASAQNPPTQGRTRGLWMGAGGGNGPQSHTLGSSPLAHGWGTRSGGRTASAGLAPVLPAPPPGLSRFSLRSEALGLICSTFPAACRGPGPVPGASMHISSTTAMPWDGGYLPTFWKRSQWLGGARWPVHVAPVS